MVNPSRMISNLRKIVLGRPRWSAQREFDYYKVTDHGLAELMRRQEEFARTGYLMGLRIAEVLGLKGEDAPLDRDVLDIGAGESLLTGALGVSSRARTVWALDAVPQQICGAARYHGGMSKGCKFVIGNASDLPFESSSFDLVVASLVMHHIEPVAPVLKEVARVLRPGGVFACNEPNPFLFALHEQGSANEAPIPMSRLIRELRAAGFVDIVPSYSWIRFGTNLLGPLSPGYSIKARMPGGRGLNPPAPATRRPLVHSGLRNLWLDSGCENLEATKQQCRQIAEVGGNAWQDPLPGQS